MIRMCLELLGAFISIAVIPLLILFLAVALGAGQ